MSQTELNDHSTRAHALLSASGSERWLNCPASARIADRYPKQDTAFTREGTLAHEVAEAMAVGPTDEPVFPDGVDQDMIRHGKSYAEYVAGLCGPDTEVMLETRVDFSQWVPDGFGTADCILLTGDTMDVIDYKYGQGVEVSAVGNPQMQLYGLGALNDYGFVYDVKKVRLHIFQPRKDNISVWETDVDHLLKFGEFAHKKAIEALSDKPGMAAGNHCKFCPHAGKCPELAKESLKFITYGDTVAPDPDSLTEEDTAYLLRMEPMISAWLKAVKAQALNSLLAGKDIPGYKVVAGKMGNRKWSDELKVAAALDAAGFSREDYTETVLLSPAAMDKAIGKKKAAEVLGALISREPGSPTIVPASDKRPAYNAADDFKNLEE